MDRSVVERYRLALFGRMVMGVAHEVDNHLSVVLGFSELIQFASGNEEKVRDSAGKILLAGEKIGAIIQSFSRYVRPHLPVPEPFVPGEVIREILLFSRYDLGRGNVVVTPPEDLPGVLLIGDRRDFALALLALLFNGSEAMAGTGGELSIRASRDGSTWEFTVEDQGPGIPAGMTDRVFEEGFTTHTGSHQSGMGLPVARHLAEQAEGAVLLTRGANGGCAATLRWLSKPSKSSM